MGLTDKQSVAVGFCYLHEQQISFQHQVHGIIVTHGIFPDVPGQPVCERNAL